jgi:hypothetical protein
MSSAPWMDTDWSYRAPALVDRSGTSGAKDAELPLVTAHQHLWDNVDTNGEDIRVTSADGETAIVYDLEALNKTSQVGTIELQAYNGQDNAHQLVYIYYGATDKSDGSATFTPSTPIDGTITPEYPSSAHVLRLFPERPGDPNPRVVLSKHTTEVSHVYIPVDMAFAGLCADYNNSRGYEGLDYLTFTVTAAGSAQADMVDETAVRVCDCGGRGERLAIRVIVKAGASGTNYTGVLTLTSTLGQVVVRTFEIRVQDPVETS